LAHRSRRPFAPGLPEALADGCAVPGFARLPPRTVQRPGLLVCLFNPHVGASLSETGLELGAVARDPVLSIAFDDDQIVARTDALGSRPIWYAAWADFVALSSSQFCLAALLDEAGIDEDATSWLLSSGYVGHRSLVRGVQRLGGDACLTLDRRAWRLAVEASSPVTTCGEPVTAEGLRDVIDKALSDVDLREPAVVPISGGADSRLLLAKLAAAHADRIVPLTWGAPDAFAEAKSDAVVAKQVCQYLELPFAYLEELSGWSDAPAQFRQFVGLSEGLVDHLLMQRLHPVIARWCDDRGISAMVRGDEPFGIRHVRTERQCRHAVYLVLAAELRRDWPELTDVWAAQVVPETLRRAAGETLPGYRDRLYRNVRIPAVQAALNGGFARHLEIVNPFLDRRVVDYASRLADAERTNKRAFREYVVATVPGVPFGEIESISETRDLLRQKDFLVFLVDRLCSSDVSRRFGSPITARLTSSLRGKLTDEGPVRRRGGLVRNTLLGVFGKRRLRNVLAYLPAGATVDPRRMALRVTMVAEVEQRLRELRPKGRPVNLWAS
jgi:hypothetical protein